MKAEHIIHQYLETHFLFRCLYYSYLSSSERKKNTNHGQMCTENISSTCHFRYPSYECILRKLSITDLIANLVMNRL